MMVTRMVWGVMAASSSCEADEAFVVHRQVGHVAAQLLDVLAGIEHGFVLGGGGDDVVAFLGSTSQTRL